MIEKEFTRQAPMVLTEEQRWCLQKESERDRVSMSWLVRESINTRYNLVGKGWFPPDDPRIQQMKDDPLPPITK